MKKKTIGMLVTMFLFSVSASCQTKKYVESESRMNKKLAKEQATTVSEREVLDGFSITLWGEPLFPDSPDSPPQGLATCRVVIKDGKHISTWLRYYEDEGENKGEFVGLLLNEKDDIVSLVYMNSGKVFDCRTDPFCESAEMKDTQAYYRYKMDWGARIKRFLNETGSLK